jgi:hypothetical protein
MSQRPGLDLALAQHGAAPIAARRASNERLNSVTGFLAPLRILCRLTSGNRQQCPATLNRQRHRSVLAVGREPAARRADPRPAPAGF